MTDGKRKPGGQPLYNGVEPKKYFFKDHPELSGKVETIKADLEAEGIKVDASKIFRFLINQNIDNAATMIREYIEGEEHGHSEQATDAHAS